MYPVMSDQQPDDSDNEFELEEESRTLVKPEPQTKTPSFYKVVILNDDFTPREFVVHLLQKFYKKSEAEATQLMLDVHQKGAGVAGVFTLEIADTKAYQSNEYSKQHKYPLRCVVEKA